MDAARLFEDELRSRQLTFRVDATDGRHVVVLASGEVSVGLDNRARDLDGGPDHAARVREFVDVVAATAVDAAIDVDELFWCLEPVDPADTAHLRHAVTRRLDRVLVHVPADRSRLRWVLPSDLDALGIDEVAAGDAAWQHLADEARLLNVHTEEVDGVRLAFLESRFPSKASLLLSPALREVVEPHVGWPVHAVLPDRGFVYVWSGDRPDFAGRLATVVVREHGRAPYPLSTEVVRIDDEVQAIGAFSSS